MLLVLECVVIGAQLFDSESKAATRGLEAQRGKVVIEGHGWIIERGKDAGGGQSECRGKEFSVLTAEELEADFRDGDGDFAKGIEKAL